MRGYTNLTEEEKAFLITMFNEVKFNKLNLQRPMDEARLRCMKNVYIQGCLKAMIKNAKKELSEDARVIIQNILDKNSLQEISNEYNYSINEGRISMTKLDYLIKYRLPSLLPEV